MLMEARDVNPANVAKDPEKWLSVRFLRAVEPLSKFAEVTTIGPVIWTVLNAVKDANGAAKVEVDPAADAIVRDVNNGLFAKDDELIEDVKPVMDTDVRTAWLLSNDAGNDNWVPDNVTVRRFVHALNGIGVAVVILFMTMFVIFVQPVKAVGSIDKEPLQLITIDVSPVHPLKADAPILTELAVIVMEGRDVHPL